MAAPAGRARVAAIVHSAALPRLTGEGFCILATEWLWRQARLLRSPRRRAGASADEIKKAYRKMALQVSPRPQSGRQGGRGAVQGGVGGLPGPLRRREAAPSTTASATPPSNRAAASAASTSRRRLRGHLRRHLRRLLRRRRGAVAARAAAARTCATTSRSPSRRRCSASRRRSASRAWRRARTCDGSGAQGRRAARHLHGLPRQRPDALPAGSVQHRQDLRAVPGARHRPARSLPHLSAAPARSARSRR